MNHRYSQGLGTCEKQFYSSTIEKMVRCVGDSKHPCVAWWAKL